MRIPGFLSILQAQLENLPLDFLERVNRPGGLEISSLIDLVIRPRDYTVADPAEVDSKAVLKNEALSGDAFWIGRESLLDGTTAHCIIANDDSFKKLSNTTLLELQLMKTSWVKHVWIMVSPSRFEDAKKIVESLGNNRKIFQQHESFCLTPDNRLHIENEKAFLHECGPGDLIPVLNHNKTLEHFMNEGGKHVMVCDGDNILGSAHPVIVGQHLLSKSNVTCEVTSRKIDDSCAILCKHAGFDQIVEQFRLSSLVDVDRFPLIATGTLVFAATLNFDSAEFKWHRTKVIMKNQFVVQYKRTLCDLTAIFQTQFVETPRSLCYMPAKELLKE